MQPVMDTEGGVSFRASDTVVPIAVAGQVKVLTALMQLASPALPIGAFSYSQGLEAAINAGRVSDEASAQAWIASHYRLAFLPRELQCLQAAARLFAAAGADHEDRLQALRLLDEQFVASRDSAEGRLETRQLGGSLWRWLHTLMPEHPACTVLDRLRDLREGDLSAPVAFAAAACAQGLSPRLAVLAWSFGWLENQVQAAVKLVPLGQSSGQRLLLALRPLCEADPPEEPWSCSALASLLMMRHERQYSRLFRS